MPTQIIITGTDTGVGKTIITAALIHRLHHQKIRAAGIKPIETGCEYDEEHHLIAADGALLQAAAPWVPAHTVAPYRFVPPVAPALAAQNAGLSLALQDLCEVITAAHHYAGLLLIEGAGGALSPMTSDGNTLDLAETLGAPILIIAKDKLGTQSQSLAVIEAAKTRKVKILGLVLNRIEADLQIEEQANAASIEHWGGIRVFGAINRCDGRVEEQIENAGHQLEDFGLVQAIVDLHQAS